MRQGRVVNNRKYLDRCPCHHC